MIIVRVELLSAITGKTTQLGVMNICNDGTSRDPKRGSYSVTVGRKGSSFRDAYAKPLRRGRVENYPRLSYSIWRLVLRALASAYPEDAGRIITTPDPDSPEAEGIDV